VVADAQKEISTAKDELSTAEHMFKSAECELATTKNELSTAKRKFTTAKYELATAEHELAIAQHESGSDKHKLASIEPKVTAARYRLDTAESEFVTVEARFFTMEHRFTTAENVFATAKRKLATVENKHRAMVSAIAALNNLATDCLRLSMHFFHPIQQCAQQVYHTAVPLSPTSSQLHGSCLQSIMDSQLSPVVAFSGAPQSWGLLLRTIDTRPRQLTCLATSVHRIIAACEDIVNIYDAVTGVLRQSLHAPETVIKIQGLPDGSILFFAHSFTVTMWDVQTGGLIHTFSVKSPISDITVSTTGNYIACGLSNGSVTVWDIHTKKKGKCFGDGQPVVTICWLAAHELAVATQSSVYIHDISSSETSNSLSFPDPVLGMIYLADKCGVLVGTLKQGTGADQDTCSLRIVGHIPGRLRVYRPLGVPWTHPGRLAHPMLAGNDIVWITPPSGVQSFNTTSNGWAKSPPLLDTATSVAASLGRNLVAQTKDSIQMFSLDVLTSDEVRDDIRPSHVYPLGERHIVCLLQPNRCLNLLELETLRELRPDDNASPLGLFLADQAAAARASFGRGLVAEFGVSVIAQVLQSGTPLPEWTEAVDEDAPLSGWSPNGTWFITVHSSPRPELHVKDMKHGIVLANLPLEDADLGTGEVYDLIFDSENRFYLKIDGPGWHVQIPHDIIPSPSGDYSHTITKEEPVPLSEPRATPPYTLDANCEWVIDAESRKICWISPGNVRRGNGGHFWAGLSLVMVGDDGVVRKLTFKEPDCWGIHNTCMG